MLTESAKLIATDLGFFIKKVESEVLGNCKLEE